jgi:hypothetical protein
MDSYKVPSERERDACITMDSYIPRHCKLLLLANQFKLQSLQSAYTQRDMANDVARTQV